MCGGLWTVPTGRRIFEGRHGEKAFEEAIAWNWLCQKTREQDQGGTSWQRELTNVRMRSWLPRKWAVIEWIYSYSYRKTLIKSSLASSKKMDENVSFIWSIPVWSKLCLLISIECPPPIPMKGWVVPLGFAKGVTWASLWSNERVQTDRAFYLAADTSCYLSLGPSCR